MPTMTELQLETAQGDILPESVSGSIEQNIDQYRDEIAQNILDRLNDGVDNLSATETAAISRTLEDHYGLQTGIEPDTELRDGTDVPIRDLTYSDEDISSYKQALSQIAQSAQQVAPDAGASAALEQALEASKVAEQVQSDTSNDMALSQQQLASIYDAAVQVGLPMQEGPEQQLRAQLEQTGYDVPESDEALREFASGVVDEYGGNAMTKDTAVKAEEMRDYISQRIEAQTTEEIQADEQQLATLYDMSARVALPMEQGPVGELRSFLEESGYEDVPQTKDGLEAFAQEIINQQGAHAMSMSDADKAQAMHEFFVNQGYEVQGYEQDQASAAQQAQAEASPDAGQGGAADAETTREMSAREEMIAEAAAAASDDESTASDRIDLEGGEEGEHPANPALGQDPATTLNPPEPEIIETSGEQAGTENDQSSSEEQTAGQDTAQPSADSGGSSPQTLDPITVEAPEPDSQEEAEANADGTADQDQQVSNDQSGQDADPADQPNNTGAEIAQAQAYMHVLGAKGADGSELVVDGLHGTNTLHGVHETAGEYGFAVPTPPGSNVPNYSEINEELRATLDNNPEQVGENIAEILNDPGASEEAIQAVQLTLRAQGHDLAADGIRGPNTVEAANSYLQEHGIDVTIAEDPQNTADASAEASQDQQAPENQPEPESAGAEADQGRFDEEAVERNLVNPETAAPVGTFPEIGLSKLFENVSLPDMGAQDRPRFDEQAVEQGLVNPETAPPEGTMPDFELGNIFSKVALPSANPQDSEYDPAAVERGLVRSTPEDQPTPAESFGNAARMPDGYDKDGLSGEFEGPARGEIVTVSNDPSLEEEIRAQMQREAGNDPRHDQAQPDVGPAAM